MGLFLFILFSFSFSSQGTPVHSVEFINHHFVEEMNLQFKNAQPFKENLLPSLSNQHWKCDLFGVKSKFQKISNISLYKFKTYKSKVSNLGAQVVKSYQLSKGELIGTKLSKNDLNQITLMDQIRILPGNRLISRLSMKNRTSKVIAFATCKSK